jgi:hypothetical protein
MVATHNKMQIANIRFGSVSMFVKFRDTSTGRRPGMMAHRSVTTVSKSHVPVHCDSIKLCFVVVSLELCFALVLTCENRSRRTSGLKSPLPGNAVTRFSPKSVIWMFWEGWLCGTCNRGIGKLGDDIAGPSHRRVSRMLGLKRGNLAERLGRSRMLQAVWGGAQGE